MEKIKQFAVGITKRDILYFLAGIVVAMVLSSVCNVSGYYRFNRNGYGMMGGFFNQPSYSYKSTNRTMMGNWGSDTDNVMYGMMTGLQGKTGDDFDKAFLSEMIVHHEGAVAMAEEVLKTSKRPELIKLANDIISAQNKEIEMMGGWNKAWFNK